VTAIYNRYGYVKEMRAVLERWAADLIGESNVTNLHAKSSDSQRPLAGADPLVERAA